ncbi:uncharacterized protein B0J16DRAFT_149887 [Fusarium flagelliforme]|uniref:Retinol dehydrogenase 12 n=1 Tax=Fusarium flagelliforme TaxID=2675880 RepID=A0A395MES9_9HYPO|nr:uncharacterized protein B0J16DRAFT_149887 [Fusarium flagelliforme]KAH7182610.1 hypothetical protein B0J16DRAFT_149887 [Fusarium flagelliforme]RFN45773.1 retinol dehydrogenase 12 [Fusarium flagelliforme]
MKDQSKIPLLPKPKKPGLWLRLFSRAYRHPYSPSDINLNGTTALVTGTTSGVGLQTCRSLLSHGVSQLIMSARTQKKGEDVAASLRILYPRADIQVWELEMESYDSVITFAERALKDLKRLDMVILNAGTLQADVYQAAYTEHEIMFQVNYLSTALLARLFVPVLRKRSPKGVPGRLTVASTSIASPHDENPYDPPTWESMDSLVRLQKTKDSTVEFWRDRFIIPRSLLHIVLYDLSRNVSPNKVIVNAVCDWSVRDTQLYNAIEHMPWLHFATRAASALVGKSLEQAAQGYIHAVAVEGQKSHGEAIVNFRIRKRKYDERPRKWRIFEEDLLDRTGREFRQLFAGKSTIGSRLYIAMESGCTINESFGDTLS